MVGNEKEGGVLEEGGANAGWLGGSEEIGYPLGVERPRPQPHADVVEGEEGVGGGEVEEGVVERVAFRGETNQVCPELVVRFWGKGREGGWRMMREVREGDGEGKEMRWRRGREGEVEERGW